MAVEVEQAWVRAQVEVLAPVRATATVREKAEGDADALLIRALSEAKANEIIRLSMSAVVLQYRALEHWDGKLPTYNGNGQVPMLTIDASKLGIGMDEATREKRLHELLAEDAPKAASDTATPPPPPAPAAPALPVGKPK